MDRRLLTETEKELLAKWIDTSCVNDKKWGYDFIFRTAMAYASGLLKNQPVAINIIFDFIKEEIRKHERML